MLNLKNFLTLEQTRLSCQLFLLLGALACIFAIINITWYYAALWAVFSFIGITFGGSIGHHRIAAHRSFNPDPWFYRFCLTVAALLGQGSPLLYSAVHSHHHAIADTADDPQTPSTVPWWRIVFFRAYQPVNERYAISRIRKVNKNDYLWTTHKYYWGVALVYIAVLALINPVLVIYAYFAPAFVSIFVMQFFVDYICHHKNVGYKNFEVGNDSANNTFCSLITAGEGLHNNHHAHANKANFAMKPGEVDIGYQMLRLLRQV
jgi:stearoyl-CoA desaturase (delta-9 desaturase)